MTAVELVRRVAGAASFELPEVREDCRRWLAESDTRSAKAPLVGQGTLL